MTIKENEPQAQSEESTQIASKDASSEVAQKVFGDVNNTKIPHVGILYPHSTTWEALDLPTLKNLLPDFTGKNDEELSEEVKQKITNCKSHLLSSFQIPNLAIFAGSGTSLGEPKGPSMTSLWNECMHDALNSGLTEDAKSATKKVNYKGSNIEHFLSMCEAYLAVHADDGDIQAFVGSCKAKILQLCSVFLERNDSDISAYEDLLAKLVRRRERDNRLTVFTTNYDMCFESAASNKGMVVLDGLSFTRDRKFDGKYFDYDIVDMAAEGSGYVQGVFKLLKLHGSVSWEREGVDVRECRSPRPEHACLIYPAKGKYQQAFIQPHLELLSRFLEYLRKPNSTLLIAGFGFEDDHLSAPIISAIESNPSLRLIIADLYGYQNVSMEAPNNAWGKLVELSQRGYNITFISASFAQMVGLIPNLESLTPAEQLAKSLQQFNSQVVYNA